MNTGAEPLAVTISEAARMLSISRTSLWRLTATGKIRMTACKRIAVEELRRHVTKSSK